MNRQVLPQTRWEIEVRSQVRKTHVVHQIGMDIAAETRRVLEIRCEQENLPAHDTNDPSSSRKPLVGAENSSFVGAI